MNRETQSIVVILMGGLLISITVTGKYTSYVRPGLGPLLVIAGVVLVLVGVISVVTAIVADVRQRGADQREDNPRGGGQADEDPAGDPGPDDHSHQHDKSKAPWLILAPVLVLLLMAPPALGADAVARNAGSQAIQGSASVHPASGPGAADGAGGPAGGYKPNDGSGHGEGTKAFAKKRPTMEFPALPAGENPSIGIKEFVMRALYDGDESVSDTPVTLTGFIAPAGDGFIGGYTIARLVVSCCAADASPMQVHVDGTAKFPVNTWVTAVVTADSGTASVDNGYVPTADITAIAQTSQPADPYEH